MANELYIFLAIASFMLLILSAFLVTLFMNYKEYKKEQKIDIVSIGSMNIAVIVTIILTTTIIWDILMETLSSIEPSDIMGTGRAVSGFFFTNFIVLSFTFVLSHSILENLHQELLKKNEDSNYVK